MCFWWKNNFIYTFVVYGPQRISVKRVDPFPKAAINNSSDLPCLYLMWNTINGGNFLKTATKFSDILVAIGTLIVENWLILFGAIALYFLFRFIKSKIPQRYHAPIATIIRIAIYTVLIAWVAIFFYYQVIRDGNYESFVILVIVVLISMILDYSDRRHKKADTRP